MLVFILPSFFLLFPLFPFNKLHPLISSYAFISLCPVFSLSLSNSISMLLLFHLLLPRFLFFYLSLCRLFSDLCIEYVPCFYWPATGRHTSSNACQSRFCPKTFIQYQLYVMQVIRKATYAISLAVHSTPN